MSAGYSQSQDYEDDDVDQMVGFGNDDDLNFYLFDPMRDDMMDELNFDRD